MSTISAQELIRRLHREKTSWKGEAPEVRWTVRAFDFAIREVRQMVAEKRQREDARRPPAPPQLATYLAGAIRVALGYIDRGDKRRAVVRLKEALERVSP
jgi:hypothetical protein